MARKRHVPKTGPLVISSEQVWQAQKPRYNGFACGHGPQGDAKYNRAKSKRAWRKELENGAPGKGLLPFAHLSSIEWRGRQPSALNYRFVFSIGWAVHCLWSRPKFKEGIQCLLTI